MAGVARSVLATTKLSGKEVADDSYGICRSYRKVLRCNLVTRCEDRPIPQMQEAA